MFVNSYLVIILNNGIENFNFQDNVVTIPPKMNDRPENLKSDAISLAQSGLEVKFGAGRAAFKRGFCSTQIPVQIKRELDELVEWNNHEIAIGPAVKGTAHLVFEGYTIPVYVIAMVSERRPDIYC